jgi:hypothetical protein
MTVTTMTPGDRVHANAATLRLRSLVALGHSAQRIARALGEPDQEIRRLINGKRLNPPGPQCQGQRPVGSLVVPQATAAHKRREGRGNPGDAPCRSCQVVLPGWPG